MAIVAALSGGTSVNGPRHCTILCNMIRSLQHHQAISLLARPQLCRCTVLASAVFRTACADASASPRAHLFWAFKPLLGSDRLLLRGNDVSEVRLVLTSHVLHGGMRDLVLHCLAIKLLIWTLVAAAASGCFCRVLIVALILTCPHPLWVRSFHPL